MSRFHVPRGRSKIAQRFIAGLWREHKTSPVRDERTHRSSPIFSAFERYKTVSALWALCCSADCQSAVSPTCSRRSVGSVPRLAECNSAIQLSAAKPQPNGARTALSARSWSYGTRGQGCPRSAKSSRPATISTDTAATNTNIIQPRMDTDKRRTVVIRVDPCPSMAKKHLRGLRRFCEILIERYARVASRTRLKDISGFYPTLRFKCRAR